MPAPRPDRRPRSDLPAPAWRSPLLRALPNALSLARLALVPVLWGVALLEMPVVLGVGVAVGASTDVLDGAIARRIGATSAFGSAVDSLADHLLSASLALWLWMLRPEFFRAEAPLMLTWMVLALTVLAVSWVRFRRFADLHLYSAKLAAVVAYLFGVALLVRGEYAPWTFHVVFAVASFAALETLWAILTRERVDEHLGSVFFRGRGG